MPQIMAECAKGALADAGLTKDDVDGYFCAGDAPGLGPLNMIEYLGLQNVRHMDSTETGGSSYLVHVNHAAQAIAAGHCNIALITLAGRPLADAKEGKSGGFHNTEAPDFPFEAPFGANVANMYAMCAKRHMHEFGTTSEQLGEIAVTFRKHAQLHDNAMMQKPMTLADHQASGRAEPVVAARAVGPLAGQLAPGQGQIEQIGLARDMQKRRMRAGKAGAGQILRGG